MFALLNAQSLESRMYAFFTIKSCSRCSTPRAWVAECMHFLRLDRARVASWAHSAPWAWKCFKMTFWGLPGPILRPGLGNAVKWASGGFLGSFCGLGLEMLQNGFLGASWAHSAAWAWKCSKMAFWSLLGPILRPGLGNAPKWPSGGFLGSFCGLGLEMLQMAFWKLPRPILRPELGNAPKWLAGSLLGPFCGLGLERL